MSSDPVDLAEELVEAVKVLAMQNGRMARTIDALLNGSSTEMSTPDGLLPVNSTGMRHAVDEWVRYRALYEAALAGQRPPEPPQAG